MNRVWRLLLVVMALQIVGAMLVYAGKDEKIPLAKVPKNVLQAAEKAVAGIKLTEAKVEKKADGLVYDLEGTVGDKEYEIEVSAAGKVLEVEQEAVENEDEQEGDQDEEKDEDGDKDAGDNKAEKAGENSDKD